MPDLSPRVWKGVVDDQFGPGRVPQGDSYLARVLRLAFEKSIIGSEAQTVWANQYRRRTAEHMISNDYSETDRRAVFDHVAARWWIDNQDICKDRMNREKCVKLIERARKVAA